MVTHLMDSSRCTLRDIARKIGKSHATVSLALRDHPRISGATKQLVKSAARELNYRPDPLLYALSQHRRAKKGKKFQALVGWINLFPERDVSKHYPTFQLYYMGAQRRCNELGFKLDTIHATAERHSTESLTRILRSRGISGILVSPHPSSGFTWNFDPTNFATVLFGYSIHAHGLNVVCTNQTMVTICCVNKLLDLGHNKIGLIVSRSVHERSAHGFVSGFLSAIKQYSLMKVFPIFFYEDRLENSKWQEWYEQYKPTGLVVENVHDAQVIQQAGIHIPKDVSVALLNIFPTDPDGWAGADQLCDYTGEVGVDTVVSMIHRNETGVGAYTKHILIEPKWKDGKSVKALEPK